MSETAERCDAWVERVLGLPVSPQGRAKFEQEEAVAARLRDQQDDDAGYGEGLKSFDIRTIHTNLSTALAAGRLVTADEWTAAATPLSTLERETLLASRDDMKLRLATLGTARTEERRLEAEAERIGQPATALDSAIGHMSDVKEGPPLYAKGSVGIPPTDFDTQITAASDKWYAMYTAMNAAKAITPPSPAQARAADLCDAWQTYWWDMKAGLEKAKAGTMAGFDPDLIPKPSMPPDFTGLASPALATAQASIRTSTPYVAPAVPPAAPANIPSTAYAAEITAAEKKWSAMLNAQWAFEKIQTRTTEQEEALTLVKQWGDYWWDVKNGLGTAQTGNAPEFDPRTITAPTQKPDLSTLKKAADGAKKTADAALEQHRKTAIEPVTKDMQACLNMLDTPENNPERAEIGAWLGKLGKLDEQIGSGTPSEQQVADKAKLLHDLQNTLFGWNDRRIRQHLPPCAEAVALADMLQAEHRKLIDHVVKERLPLPVPDPDSMTPDEENSMQASWTKLRDGSGNVKVPATPTGTSTSQDEANQFRSETLANFARLLGSPSGRKLLGDLEKTGKDVQVVAGTDAACSITGTVTGGARPRLPTGGTPTTDEEARANKGTGSGSSVTMVRGAKDSDVALNTESGSPLHAPRFIALGHELVHALHNARGINRADMTLTDDPAWNNPEELQTIRTGGLSEQTLRNQYGLSAERFGHKHTEPGSPVAAAYTAELDAIDLPPSTDKHGFDHFETWPPRLRKAVAEASPPLTGPLPTGWDPNQLNLEQMRLIIAGKLPADLKPLGWSPLELAPPGSGERIDQVLAARKAHPRSPQGLRYRHLGGDPAIAALQSFHTTTRIDVATWTDASWPTKLQALEAADSWLTAFGKAKSGEFATIATTGKLPQKLEKMAAAIQRTATPPTDPAAADAQRFTARGGLTALNAISQLNTVLGAALPVPDAPVSAMLAALDKADAWLQALAAEIEKLRPEHANPLTHIMSSSLGSSSALPAKLGDVVMCFRRGRAVTADFLSAAIREANKVL